MLVILAACLPILFAWQNQEAETRGREERQQHAERISTLISGALSERMLAGGDAQVWRDVEEVAEAMRVAGTALRVQVLSTQGVVKASTDAALRGHAYGMEAAGCVTCHAAGQPAVAFPVLASLDDGEGRPITRIFTPIAKQPACVRCHAQEEAFRGMLAIDFDRSDEETARQERLVEMLVFAAVSALGIFLLMEWLLGRLVLHPLRELGQATQALAGGRLDARLASPGEDELGQVGRHFNDMAARIQTQMGELARNNQELDLLYRLMVDLSGSLSVADVQGTVLHLLRERLRPDYLAFAVECNEGEWDCAWVDRQGQSGRQRGRGGIEELAWLRDEGLRAIAPFIDNDTSRRALAEQRVIHMPADSGCACVLPFLHNGRPIGLLYAGRGPETATLDQEILDNLAVHVGLALSNARNFTHAITDGLTGLYNKRYGSGRLGDLIYDARRYGYALSLIMLDIDHFKRVNDTYGHPAGDAVLQAVARRLRGALRQSDLPVRYGGEEFMLLLPHADLAHGLAVAEKLRRVIADESLPLNAEGDTLAVTISLGVVQMGVDEPMEQLVGRADQALYRAKGGGRNRVEAG